MLRVLARHKSWASGSGTRVIGAGAAARLSTVSPRAQEAPLASKPRPKTPKIKLENLTDILREMIKTTGPISLSKYMKTCLVHPEFGYYTQKDPLGSSGDFVTSPEISQMFGEMVGVWFYTIFAQRHVQRANLIEFGPGKGTLMHDALKTLHRLHRTSPSAKESPFRVILIEASPVLRNKQKDVLCGEAAPMRAQDVGWTCTTQWGDEVVWVETELDVEIVSDLKTSANFVVCHEFFDALPILQFEKTKDGWRECVVDYQNGGFNVTIEPKLTTTAYLPSNSPRHNALPLGSRCEISPETLTYAKKIHEFLVSNPASAALFVDYGPKDTIPINTFRGIRDHKIVSPFLNPGHADLSADVDFQGIKELMLNLGNVHVYGPTEQGDFLHELGIAHRAQQLIDSVSTDAEKEKVFQSYRRLVDKGGSAMGKIYKFMGVLSGPELTPVGFGGDFK